MVSSEKPVTGEVTGPQGGPTVILLDGLGSNYPLNSYHYVDRLMQFSILIREASLAVDRAQCGATMHQKAEVGDGGVLSPKFSIPMAIQDHNLLPGLREHLGIGGKGGRKMIGISGG